MVLQRPPSFFFFFNDTATPEIYTFPLHAALPISLLRPLAAIRPVPALVRFPRCDLACGRGGGGGGGGGGRRGDWGGRPAPLGLRDDRRWHGARRREPFPHGAQRRSGRLPALLRNGRTHERTRVRVRRTRAQGAHGRVVEGAAGVGREGLLARRERDRRRGGLPPNDHFPGRDPLRRPSRLDPRWLRQDALLRRGDASRGTHHPRLIEPVARYHEIGRAAGRGRV